MCAGVAAAVDEASEREDEVIEEFVGSDEEVGLEAGGGGLVVAEKVEAAEIELCEALVRLDAEAQGLVGALQVDARRVDDVLVEPFVGAVKQQPGLHYCRGWRRLELTLEAYRVVGAASLLEEAWLVYSAPGRAPRPKRLC